MAFSYFKHPRRFLRMLVPSSLLGRMTLYVAFIRMGIFVGEQAALYSASRGAVAVTQGWGGAFNVILGILLVLLGLRWIRRDLMWGLRNRLIVTYVFIGVIPVALVICMALIAFYLFANQYATSQARQALDSETRVLEVIAKDLSAGLEQKLPAKNAKPVIWNSPLVARHPGVTTEAWLDGRLVAATQPDVKDPTPPKWLTTNTLVQDGEGFYLVAVTSTQTKSGELLVAAREQLNNELIKKAAAGLGEVTIWPLVRARGENAERNASI